MIRRRASSLALLLPFAFENVLQAEAAPYMELPEPAGWPLLLGGIALILVGRAARLRSARRGAGRPSAREARPAVRGAPS